MLPRLLWRCPLCATNDALTHRERWLQPDLITCGVCNAQWQLRRIAGDGFYLMLTRSSAAQSDCEIGTEQSIAVWYDRMKSTIKLTPLQDHSGLLQVNEQLYLRSGKVEMQAEASDPLFFPEAEPPDANQAIGDTLSRYVGTGRLLLTNQRMIWVQEERKAAGSTKPVSFMLRHILSAHAIFGISLLVQERLYMLYFPDESMLKWITYLNLITVLLAGEPRHRIKTTHW